VVITVLHDAPDPEAVLAELRKVAKRILVIEEILAAISISADIGS
jgi:hypothetical protein